jgi:hypothetical protein
MARQEEERKQQQMDAEWESLDAKGRASKAIRVLSLVMGKQLPTRYYSGLLEAFESGRMNPREVTEAALKAQISLRLATFIQELMRTLDGLG